MEYEPKTFDSLARGDVFLVGPRTISRANIDAFTELSGDRTALHSDDEYARSTPFGGVVAHGVLNLAVATGLAYESGVFEGTVLAVRGMDVSFERPVRPGESVRMRLEVHELDDRPRPDRAKVAWDVRLLNQDDRIVMKGIWSLLMRRNSNTKDAAQAQG